MRDKDAHLMMEGLYKEAGMKPTAPHGSPTGPPAGWDPKSAWKSGKAAPVNWFQKGAENPAGSDAPPSADPGPGNLRQEVEQYLSAQPEVQAAVLAIVDKYLAMGSFHDGRHSR